MDFNEKMISAKKYLAILCFLGMTVVVPLYYHEAYFDIIPAKGRALCLVLIPVLAGFLAVSLVQLIQKKKIEKSGKDFCALDAAMLLFFLAVLIAWLHTENKLEAFWGTEGWSVGAFVLMGSVVCYFLMSRHLPDTQNLWLVVLLVNIVIFAIAVLHSMGIDVLSLHEYIEDSQWYQYLSTVGQMNGLMGYLSLVFPVFAVFFIVSRERASVILYGILVVLGEAAVILCASDGIFIAIAVCMFFLLPFVWKEKARMLRFMKMIAGFGINLICIAVLPPFRNKLESMDGVARWITRVPVGIVLCLVALVGAVVSVKLMEKKERLWRILLYVVEVLMGLVELRIFIWHAAEYRLYSYWGSGRKYLWEYSWELFRSFSLPEKLFGVGPEMLGQYYEECYEYFGATVLVAHSEFLQYLLTLGILGAAAWAGICIAVIYTFYKYRSEEKLTIAFFLALVAYFAQSLVCSPQAVTAAVLCVMLSCYRKSL